MAIRLMNDRFFNECVVRDEAAKLHAIRLAIPAWERVATEQIKAEESADLSMLSNQQRDWRADYINDQNYLIDATTNALFAGLAVSVTAAVENTMGMLCAEQGASLPQRAHWGHKVAALQSRLGKSALSSLPSFAFANRARLLGNCFKHNSGKTNQEWVDAFTGVLDEEIRYADEDWKGLIDGVREFLLALVAALP
jgi:hypothetical protein